MAGTAPTPTLTTFQDHQLVRAADFNGIATHLSGLFTRTMGGFRTYKPYVSLHTNVNRPLASNTDAFLTFDVKGVDTDGMFSPATPTRLVVNTAGWYRLAFQAHWDTNNAGQRVNRILANGTNPNTNAIATDNRNCLGLGEGTTTFCQCVAHLAAGTLIYPYVWQNSGTTVQLQMYYSGSQFFAEWVAPY